MRGLTMSAEYEAQHYPLPAIEDPFPMHIDNNIPTVPLKYCEFNKARRVLKLASEFFGMPREFYVESHHTGRLVRFVPVQPGDRLFDEDHWDGEQQIYRPAAGEDRVNVDHMVIYHQF